MAYLQATLILALGFLQAPSMGMMASQHMFFQDGLLAATTVSVRGNAAYEHPGGIIISAAPVEFFERWSNGEIACPISSLVTVEMVEADEGTVCRLQVGNGWIPAGTELFHLPADQTYSFKFVRLEASPDIRPQLFDGRWSSKFNSSVQADLRAIVALATAEQIPLSLQRSADSAAKDLVLKSSWYWRTGDRPEHTPAMAVAREEHPNSDVDVTVAPVFQPPLGANNTLPCRAFYVAALWFGDNAYFESFPKLLPSDEMLAVGSYYFWLECGPIRTQPLRVDVVPLPTPVAHPGLNLPGAILGTAPPPGPPAMRVEILVPTAGLVRPVNR